MNSSMARPALVLGLLSAIGPFAIDMYLPAFPAIVRELNIDPAAVQFSLIGFFLAVAGGQLLYGPASDILGRRPPLFFGLVLFVIGSLGCGAASGAETLTSFRFLQGIGACAPMAIIRAVVRDLHTGVEATRLMSMVMLVLSVSPILAPLVGSLIVSFFDWRAIFWLISSFGVVGFMLVLWRLPETRMKADRQTANLAVIGRNYLTLLRDRHYMGTVLIGGLSQGCFFAYIAAASFLLINHYGLKPWGYGLAFSMNAMSFIAATQVNGFLVARIGAERLIGRAVTTLACLALTLLTLTLLHFDSLWLLCGLMIPICGSQGFIIPPVSVLAMHEHGPIAGAASALMGTLQLVLGTLVICAISMMPAGTALPMVGAIAICSAGAFISFALTFGFRTEGDTR